MTSEEDPKRFAIARVTLAESWRYTGEEGQLFRRTPHVKRLPVLSTARHSECLRATQAGMDAVGVPRITLMPCLAAVAIASSSHPNRKVPSSGSMNAHANSASRATLNPARSMRAASLSQRSDEMCSGYQAVPKYIHVTP